MSEFLGGPLSQLTLMILRVGFLLLLWLFVFAIVYALRSDLFGAPVRRLPSDGSRGGSPATPPTAAPVITPSGGALPSAGGSPPLAPPAAEQAPPAAQPTPDLPSAGTGGAARRLVITSGVASGTTIPLDEDTLTIGRSSDSSLVIVDEYTSTYHAKLSRTGDEWLLTDLDSTNGTKVNGARISGTVLVPAFAPVTIGTTTFELRP